MLNYLISGKQGSGKSVQAAALAGKNPLYLCREFNLKHLDEDNTAIIVDEVNDIELIKEIVEQQKEGIFHRLPFTQKKVEITLPIILIAYLPLDELVKFFGEEWSILITNYPNPTLQVSFYENK